MHLIFIITHTNNMNNMNNEQEEYYDTAVDYLKKKFKPEEYMNNEKIKEIYEYQHERNFNMDCRSFIEHLNKKYIELYSYSGFLAKDLNNINWERIYDITYNNVSNDIDIHFIFNNADDIIDILENNI